MKAKNLIHELIPAEKRLAKIDEIDRELERRLAAQEITLVEYFETKQPLTVKRFKEFRLVARARGWNLSENLDVPEVSEALEEPEVLEVLEPAKPVPIRQRLLGFLIVLLMMCAVSWV